jgi:hypothetical protein
MNPTSLLFFCLVTSAAMSDPAGAQRPAGARSFFRFGAVYDCQLTHETSLVFDGKAFVPKSSNMNARVQIKILKTELEMTVSSPFTGEIVVEKDVIVSRAWNDRSVFAIYQAPIGNIVSLALHALKNGDVIYTQSKTMQEPSDGTVFQNMASGRCRDLHRF